MKIRTKTMLKETNIFNLIGPDLIKVLFNLIVIYLALKIPEFENVYHVIITLLVFYIVIECSD